MNENFNITSFKEGYLAASIRNLCENQNRIFIDVEGADLNSLVERAFSVECVEAVRFHKAENNSECLVMTIELNKEKCSKKQEGKL